MTALPTFSGCALASRTDLCPPRIAAMTGEMTLAGQVLPVGGLREKLTSAHRSGIKKVLAPLACKPDIEHNVRALFASSFPRWLRDSPPSLTMLFLSDSLLLFAGSRIGQGGPRDCLRRERRRSVRSRAVSCRLGHDRNTNAHSSLPNPPCRIRHAFAGQPIADKVDALAHVLMPREESSR